MHGITDMCSVMGKLLFSDIINGFGLLVRWPEDPQERLLAFKVSGDESQKSAIIKDLSQLLAQTNYSTMAVSQN